MNIAELAQLTVINEIEEMKVNELVESIIANGWNGQAILFHSGQNQAITGSHRIVAAQKLVELDESNEWENEYSEIEIKAIAVDQVIESYCEDNEITLDQIEYDNLKAIFEGTEFEAEAKQNIEW